MGRRSCGTTPAAGAPTTPAALCTGAHIVLFPWVRPWSATYPSSLEQGTGSCGSSLRFASIHEPLGLDDIRTIHSFFSGMT